MSERWKQLATGSEELLKSLEGRAEPEVRDTVDQICRTAIAAGNSALTVRPALFRSAFHACLADQRMLGDLLYRMGWETDPDLTLAGVARSLVPHAVSHNTALQAEVSAICETRKVIFITGCARSGTTLTIRCVGGTAAKAHVFWREAWISAIREVGDASTIVLKRSGVDHRFFDLVPAGAHVLHVVRHPADTCTSRMPGREGFYVSPERWLAEHEAAKQLLAAHPAERLTVVRYEDLLSEPDAVQATLADKWGMQFDLPFSRYHERNGRDTSLDREGQPYVWPPVKPDAAFRHRKTDEDADRVSSFTSALGPAYAEFCDMFGYATHDRALAL